MKFSVPDMSCGHCVTAIEKAVAGKDPTANVVCDLESRTVEVSGSSEPGLVEAAIKAAGYEPAFLNGS